MREILVYIDEGVGARSRVEVIKEFTQMVPQSQYHVRAVRAAELKRSDLHNVALLIMPGGADIPYDRKLRGEGNQRIRHYVEQGGAYLGLCAGAYYGCARIEFDKGGELEVCAERELAFFPGVAVGPAFVSPTYSYEDERGALAVELEVAEMSPEKAVIYFNGGCYFQDANLQANTEIVAKFTTLPDTPAAIVLCKVGKGRVLLSGVYPSYSYEVFDTKDPYLSKIIHRLKVAEDGRVALLKLMLKKLGIV